MGGGSEMKKRAVLWGHGAYYRSRLDRIRSLEAKGRIEVIGITGKNPDGAGQFDGYPYIPPQELSGCGHDLLFIMSAIYEKEIREDYLKLPGSVGDKVVPARVLDLPGLTFPRYMEIRALRPTIFSVNCWGGYLYHTLGLECLSPFKNLWVPGDEYLKFLEDPEYYLSLEPEFVRMEKGHNEGEAEEYPVLRLDDVRLFCDHSRTAQEASDAWTRRKEKINRDFMMAMFFTGAKEREERFHNIRGYDRKVCFVPRPDGDGRSAFLPQSRELYAYDVLMTATETQPVFDYYSFFFGTVTRL